MMTAEGNTVTALGDSMTAPSITNVKPTEVQHGRFEDLLTPGDQSVTAKDASIDKVRVKKYRRSRWSSTEKRGAYL